MKLQKIKYARVFALGLLLVAILATATSTQMGSPNSALKKLDFTSRCAAAPGAGMSGSPSPAAPAPAWTYLGCYRDRADRDLQGAHLESSDMTMGRCQSYCWDNGFAFAATQYGSQCYCGDSFGRYGKAPGKCNMPCGGNSQIKCGGTWASSVFLLGVKE